MPYQEPIKLESWQQYTSCRDTLSRGTIYPVLYHASGCGDCDVFLPRWHKAVKDANLPEKIVPVEYLVGTLGQLMEKKIPEIMSVREELERVSGSVSVPTLVIFRGQDPQRAYGDEELISFSHDAIRDILRESQRFLADDPAKSRGGVYLY